MLPPTLLITLLASVTAAWPSPQARKVEKKKNPKYFHEMSGSQALLHYDARYFVGEEVPYARHRYVLRGLITSYLNFFELQGYETWIAHGTLLGWWWNGRIMPWDLDLDVQVTANTMQFMADNYNRTEHAWNYTVPHEHGKHNEIVQTKYLFDINPHHNDTEVDRMNIIDARWIDMSTGMYVDLTVLKERNPANKPGVWSCTNNHRYLSSDLWPLRRTEFEGVPALIPREFEKILAEEYGRKGLVKEDFNEHFWNHKIKQWVMNDVDEKELRLADAAAQKQREMNGLDPDDEEPHQHDHNHSEEGEDHDHVHDEEVHDHDQEGSHDEDKQNQDDGHDHAPAVPETEKAPIR